MKCATSLVVWPAAHLSAVSCAQKREREKWRVRSAYDCLFHTPMTPASVEKRTVASCLTAQAVPHLDAQTQEAWMP